MEPARPNLALAEGGSSFRALIRELIAGADIACGQETLGRGWRGRWVRRDTGVGVLDVALEPGIAGGADDRVATRLSCSDAPPAGDREDEGGAGDELRATLLVRRASTPRSKNGSPSVRAGRPAREGQGRHRPLEKIRVRTTNLVLRDTVLARGDRPRPWRHAEHRGGQDAHDARQVPYPDGPARDDLREPPALRRRVDALGQDDPLQRRLTAEQIRFVPRALRSVLAVVQASPCLRLRTRPRLPHGPHRLHYDSWRVVHLQE
jgi:hypothetical protein